MWFFRGTSSSTHTTWTSLWNKKHLKTTYTLTMIKHPKPLTLTPLQKGRTPFWNTEWTHHSNHGTKALKWILTSRRSTLQDFIWTKTILIQGRCLMSMKTLTPLTMSRSYRTRCQRLLTNLKLYLIKLRKPLTWLCQTPIIYQGV